MEIMLCEKCGQAFFKEKGMNNCPQCYKELLDKIHNLWFEHEQDLPNLPRDISPSRRDVWELNVQERLERLLKKIPANIAMNNEIVYSVRQIPVEQREWFYDNLKLLLYRIDLHQE